jgi:predicted peptidase
MLVESGFVTKSDNTLTGRKTVNIVTTQYEEETVYIHADRVLIELGKYTAFESSLLNNDIIENLDMLKYFDIFKFYSPDSQVYHSMVPSDIDLSVDYLSLFIYFYGNTMAIQK